MYGSLGSESSGSPQKNPCLKPRIVRLNPIGIRATKLWINTKYYVKALLDVTHQWCKVDNELWKIQCDVLLVISWCV